MGLLGIFSGSWVGPVRRNWAFRRGETLDVINRGPSRGFLFFARFGDVLGTHFWHLLGHLWRHFVLFLGSRETLISEATGEPDFDAMWGHWEARKLPQIDPTSVAETCLRA